MKAYTYTAQELGLPELPKGTLRLGGFETTTLPSDADAFVCPCDIRHLTHEQIHALPYLSGNETRHCFYCISDRPNRALGVPSIIFRADANKWLVEKEPTTVPWPWPVADLWREHEPFQYDTVFYGWDSTPLTRTAVESCQRAGLHGFYQLNDTFYGTWESQNNVEMLTKHRKGFLDSLSCSRLSLCARSIAEGIVRYRFYEAMSMGRVPVHICDGRALPFADRIDYEACTIHVKESDTDKVGDILKRWLLEHDDDHIRQMGLYGRQAWDTWLNGNKWDDLFGQVAREKLSLR